MRKILSTILGLILVLSMVNMSGSAAISATTETDEATGGTTIIISEDFNDFGTTKTNPHSKDADYCQPNGWYLAHRWSSQVNGFLRPATDAEKGAVMQVGMLGNDGGSSHAYLPLNKDITSGVVTISYDMKPERVSDMWNDSWTDDRTPNLVVMVYPDGIDSSDMEWASGESLSIGKPTSSDDQTGRYLAGIFAHTIGASRFPGVGNNADQRIALKELTVDEKDTKKVSDADSKWYEMKIELDFDKGTTTYWLDGAQTAGESLAALNIDGIQGISFGTPANSRDASTLIDNVKVAYTYGGFLKTDNIKNEDFDDFAITKTTPHSKDTDYCQPDGWYLAHRWSSQVNGFLRPATDAEKGAVMQVGMLGNDGGSSHAYLPFGKDITSGVVTISYDMKPERAGNLWNGSFAHTQTPNLLVMVYPDGIDMSDMEWASGESLSIGKNTLGSNPATTPIGKPIAGIFARNISTANDPDWESMTILKALTMDTTDENKVSDADSKWYEMKIELDFDNGTTTYYLDGAETRGATLENLGIDGIQGISLDTRSNAVDASTLIDNVSVTYKYQVDSLKFGEFKLVDENGAEVSYSTVNSGDKFYLKTTVQNVDDSDNSLMLALARYNDGVLEEIDFEAAVIKSGETFKCGIGMEYEILVDRPDEAEEYCKIFAFDSLSLKPYVEAVTYYDGEHVSLLFDNSVKNTALLNQPPVNISGTEYLPLEYVAGLVNYQTVSEGDVFVVTGGDDTVILEERSSTAVVNGDTVSLSSCPIEREGELLVTTDIIESILPIGEDLTDYSQGVALHTEYYSDDTSFFNLVTTFTGDPKTQRGFSWEAMPEYSNMVIEYSEGNGLVNPVSVKATAEMYPVLYNYTSQNNETDDGISYYDNMLFYKVKIEGLKPGTSYTYRIGDKVMDEWSEEYTFTTEGEENNEFSFIAVADSQEQNVSGFEYYKKTLDKALSDDEDAAFLMHLGDIVESGMCDDWWNMFFNASKGVNESLPIVPVVGNHETRINGTKYYNLHFNNPENGKGLVGEDFDYSSVKQVEANVIKELDNTVYSFDYGNAHFAVLNTGTDWADDDWATAGLSVLELQKEWLKADMAQADANGAKWKVVVMHIGVYTARDRKSAYEFHKTIDECGIDLVLSGHDHVTLRTKQMYGDKVDEEKGSVYAIMGSAGTKRYGFNSGSYSYINLDKVAVSPTETDSKNPTYNILTFGDDSITVISKGIDGTIIDSYTITK